MCLTAYATGPVVKWLHDSKRTCKDRQWPILWHVTINLLLCIHVFNNGVPTAKATEYNVD
jgi:hypothetical protein